MIPNPLFEAAWRHGTNALRHVPARATNERAPMAPGLPVNLIWYGCSQYTLFLTESAEPGVVPLNWCWYHPAYSGQHRAWSESP